MTAKQAIQTGKKFVNAPIYILLGMPLACVLVYYWMEDIDDIRVLWAALKAVGIGFALAWLYWSFVAPKWLVWAYKNVENKSELHARAVDGKLIWRKGHWANKTLIFFKKDKAFVDEIEQNINYNISVEPSEREMDIYISTPTFLVLLLIISFLLIGGIAVIIENIGENDMKGIGFGAAVMCIGIYGLFRKLPFINFPPFITFTKKYFSGEAQISVNQTGISIRQEHTGLIEWKDLLYLNVEYNSNNHAEKLHFAYNDGTENISVSTDLELLSGDFEEMEYLIRHYQNKV